jgi:predicted dehydrogenase
MDKLKIGVVGVGSLGSHHARIYADLEGAELVGVFDVNADRAAEVATQCGARAFEDLHTFARHVDAASVVVPTDKHFETYSTLAQHDLHMLVEKPIAPTTREAEHMVQLAHDKDLILQVGHVERFNPVMTFLEKNLAHPRFIEATRLACYPVPREDGLPRGTEVSVVLDLMIHDIEIILHIVNSTPREIHAVGVPILSSSEDIANARISFENGCVANVTSSRVSQKRLRQIRIFQEDTYVSLDYTEQTGQLLRIKGNGIAPEEVPITKGEPLVAELSAFVECVRQRNDPVVTGLHASRALDLAVDICKRIRECPS